MIRKKKSATSLQKAAGSDAIATRWQRPWDRWNLGAGRLNIETKWAVWGTFLVEFEVQPYLVFQLFLPQVLSMSVSLGNPSILERPGPARTTVLVFWKLLLQTPPLRHWPQFHQLLGLLGLKLQENDTKMRHHGFLMKSG